MRKFLRWLLVCAVISQEFWGVIWLFMTWPQQPGKKLHQHIPYKGKGSPLCGSWLFCDITSLYCDMSPLFFFRMKITPTELQCCHSKIAVFFWTMVVSCDNVIDEHCADISAGNNAQRSSSYSVLYWRRSSYPVTDGNTFFIKIWLMPLIYISSTLMLSKSDQGPRYKNLTSDIPLHYGDPCRPLRPLSLCNRVMQYEYLNI